MKSIKTFSVGLLAAVLTLNAAGIFAQEAPARPTRGGGGADIIVFDIVDSAVPNEGRPAGGGGGGDIIVFDIVDSVAAK